MHLRDVIKVMDEKKIERLLDKFDKSSLKNFELTQDDFKLALSKREAGDQVVVGEPTLTTPNDTVSAPKPTSKQSQNESTTPAVNSAADVAEIKAPLVGVIYFAPSPDKPAFKKQGDKVEKGDVVCVIEAMKMINEVKSDVSGTISNILVEDGSMVEYDQPLFQVKKG